MRSVRYAITVGALWLLAALPAYGESNLDGVSGLLATPSAEVVREGDVEFAYGRYLTDHLRFEVPPIGRSYSAIVGYLPHLEITARFVDYPDTPDTNGLPWILVDRVKYNDNSPWPESPDGDGPSLERIAPTLYGNDPINWSASAQSTGTPGAANSGVIVSKTAGWKFHDRGSDLGSGWRGSAYDDSGW